MGKKTKVGKDRKDKFYKLAKETGFRSRAAFKLIQLNRRFGFLQQSQVCVDLCAAPGGWMQVAKQNMPVSSIVIGIDLYAIKPIAGCISLVEDITTEKCRQLLTKELKTWKVDVFLNDGAPNVGRNWLFDAYQQICLSLSAVKLATEFLRPGGWFITKVFRSKDYNAFVWVLKQLFKKVYATKPSASRKESAEIFVVCQGYKAPDKIDQKFMDPKYVFEELEIEPAKKIDMLKDTSSIKKAKAVGYDAIDLRKIMNVSEFLRSSSALDVLQVATELKFDDERIANHPLTTFEIKECFKDIKVLGRKDLKDLIKWWKKLKDEFYPEEKKKDQETIDAVESKPLTDEQRELFEMEEMEKFIEEMKVEEEKDSKRKKKKENKEKSKTMQKVALKMAISDGGPQDTGDENIFNLREIKNKEVLKKMVDGVDKTKKKTKGDKKQQPKAIPYDEDELHDDEIHVPNISSDLEPESEDEFTQNLGLNDDDQDDDNDNWKASSKNGKKLAKGGEIEKNRNPLLNDLDYRDKDVKRLQKAQLWFEKDSFKNLEKTEDNDEDMDLDKLVKNYKKKGIEVIGESDKPDLSKLGRKARQRAKHGLNKDDSSDSEIEDEKSMQSPISDDDDDDDDEIENQPKTKKYKLSEEELALGQLMITNKKSKRDLVDGAWNRYMFNDDNLPEWFVEDEKKSMKRNLPVPEDLVQSYRQNLTEFNTRSIKKVMEAKTRKKRRDKKKLEKLSKKAAVILDNADHSGQEKVKMLKKLYKKTEKKKQEVTYVVSKKAGTSGKKVSRPAGVKGRFKVVDPRLKKDMRAEKKSMKKNRGKTSGSKKGGKSMKIGKQRKK